MMTSNLSRFEALVTQGLISEKELSLARRAAEARGKDLEQILIAEFGLERKDLLGTFSRHYKCLPIEYDERLPVPTELFGKLPPLLFADRWFPVIKEGKKIVIAALDPEDREMREEIKNYFGEGEYEFRVALPMDIKWWTEDYLHARPEALIGIERTGLAFWRNTMAHWRTRLACYRNDLARARTALAFLRWGFGFIALSDALLHMHRGAPFVQALYWLMMAGGMTVSAIGTSVYLKVRRSRMSPPRHQTLVEVTAATAQFLEAYHLQEASRGTAKKTMLGRLGDFIMNYCTILPPVPASKERTHLARERNVLAAQRTLAACYRTIYSRARTGLAFIRTGIAFPSLGLLFLKYFGMSILSAFDMALMLSGLLMLLDGALWYLPARKEQEEIQRVSNI
jgi:uncharacterized membrane protein YidH (DUF202 family)